MKSDPDDRQLQDRLTVEQLYSNASRWLRDFDFYADEIRFFHKIISKYLIEAEPSIKPQTTRLQEELSEFEMQQHLIRDEILTQRDMADFEIRGLINKDAKDLNAGNTSIAAKIQDHEKAFHAFKLRLFEVTEKVLQSID